MNSDKTEETKSCGCNVYVPYKAPLDRLQNIYVCIGCGKDINIFEEDFARAIENNKFIVIGKQIPFKCWEEIKKITNKRLETILSGKYNIEELVSQGVRIF